MDYEVFLLSRMKEFFDATGDNEQVIALGLQGTGWLITCAAALFAVVVGAFARSHIIFIQEIGLGLALAVIVDATLIRMLLVPASMRLFGCFNWWASTPLRAVWHRIGLNGTDPKAVARMMRASVASQVTQPLRVTVCGIEGNDGASTRFLIDYRHIGRSIDLDRIRDAAC